MDKSDYTELRKFKDTWAQDKGYEDWYDYRDHCESHGFSEDEVGYDQLMFDYGQMIVQKSQHSEEKDYNADNWLTSHIQND